MTDCQDSFCFFPIIPEARYFVLVILLKVINFHISLMEIGRADFKKLHKNLTANVFLFLPISQQPAFWRYGEQ